MTIVTRCTGGSQSAISDQRTQRQQFADPEADVEGSRGSKIFDSLPRTGFGNLTPALMGDLFVRWSRDNYMAAATFTLAKDEVLAASDSVQIPNPDCLTP